MRRILLFAAAAGVAVVPAVLGLAGNATLSQSIPAVIPAGASLLPPAVSAEDEDHSARAPRPTQATHETAKPRAGDSGRDDATSSHTAAAHTSSTADSGRGSDAGAKSSAGSGSRSGASSGSGSGGKGSGDSADSGGSRRKSGHG